jgi:hypothetical protein
MGIAAQTRLACRRFLARLREFSIGLTMPTRGDCLCDPVAWERDARMRIQERDEASGRPSADRATRKEHLITGL